MNYSITQDKNGTHLDWEHENVSSEMIDWFWSNMEKCFLLWHPEEHEPLQWAISPKNGNLVGAVHIAPQTWSDGRRQNLYIRFENFDNVPKEILQYVEYEHCIIVAGLGFGENIGHFFDKTGHVETGHALSLQQQINQFEPLGYRIHQWQKNGDGVKGKSNAFGWKKSENHAEGMVWAKHAATEISNWGVFLPQLFKLYKVVKNPLYNPFMDLTIERTKNVIKYKSL